MNARRSLAAWFNVAAFLLVASVLPSSAELTGPFCYRTNSGTSKVYEYRLYFDMSPDGHYTIGGRALIRTPTALGTIVLSYPVHGGGFTISGGDIWVGLRLFWVNTAVSTTVAAPFDANLYIDGSASQVTEQIGSSRQTYPLIPLPVCPEI
jgi:hypothetical protein